MEQRGVVVSVTGHIKQLQCSWSQKHTRQLHQSGDREYAGTLSSGVPLPNRAWGLHGGEGEEERGGEGWEEGGGRRMGGGGGKKDGRGMHGQTGEFIRDSDSIVITTYINFPEDGIYNFPLQKKNALVPLGGLHFHRRVPKILKFQGPQNFMTPVFVYFRPAYVLNIGKWNGESTDQKRRALTLFQEEA